MMTSAVARISPYSWLMCKHSAMRIFVYLFFFGIPQIAFSQDDIYSLGIVAYNYTDFHISDYRVNNVGGGNVFLSSPTSGGSGVACCFNFQKNGSKVIKVKVRWQFGGCKYVFRNAWTSETAEITHYFYREEDLTVEPLVQRNPHYLEMHFNADGSVQARITSSISKPKVIKNADRLDKSIFVRCKNGEKPQQQRS